MDPIFEKFLDWTDGLDGSKPAEKFPFSAEYAPNPLTPEELESFIKKLLTHPKRAEGLRALVESGLSEFVMPELASLIGVEQPEEFHPEGDCFVHTILTIKNLSADASFSLALAALLHDIGKPGTFTNTDRIRFHGHEVASTRIAKKIMKRMKLDKDTVDYVSKLIALHMQIKDVDKMSPKNLTKLVRKPWFSDLVELTRADCMASHGDLSAVDFALEKSKEIGPEPPPPPPPLVTGHDLISMGLSPGPDFAKILALIETLRSEGKITSREEALRQALKICNLKSENKK